MEALYLLVPLSLLIVAAAVWIFFRMADSGQFDDPVGPAHQILLDDDRPAPAATASGPPGADPRAPDGAQPGTDAQPGAGTSPTGDAPKAG